MDRFLPNLKEMRKYREMGFDRHHILEAWDQCQGREYYLIDTLKKIRSRDQLLSEQRLVWNGNTHVPIKRIVNQTPLKRLSTRNDREEYPWGETRKEFQWMKKKGLLLKKEYRGLRDLCLEYQGRGSLRNKSIQRVAKEMKGYLRRMKHLSIKFDFSSGGNFNIGPLLKSIKHCFVGLESLKLSLKKKFRLESEDLYGFDRLFAQLKPTLKHLDLDFAGNSKSQVNFPEILGWIIMKNLHKLEILCLNFRNTQVLITLVKFFINTACPRMRNLRGLRLQMENCFLSHNENFSRASFPSNLQNLKIDFDNCFNLTTEYLSKLQNDILVTCPALEELCIRLPNYKRFSGEHLSTMKEKFLQKLNLKRFSLELSHDLQNTWNYYQDIQALEATEEMRLENLACKFKQKGQGEEEFLLYCEILIDEEEGEELLYEDLDEDQAIDDIQDIKKEMEYLRKLSEREVIEEQEEAERILRGDLAKEELEAMIDMEVMAD